MEEVWKSVVGYEEIYEVSNLGRVRSLDRPAVRLGREVILKSKILQQSPNTRGYPKVRLYDKAGESKTHPVHILVANHFLESSELPEVNHKDLNKMNARATNLEWTTRLGNMTHARENGAFS